MAKWLRAQLREKPTGADGVVAVCTDEWHGPVDVGRRWGGLIARGGEAQVYAAGPHVVARVPHGDAHVKPAAALEFWESTRKVAAVYGGRKQELLGTSLAVVEVGGVLCAATLTWRAGCTLHDTRYMFDLVAMAHELAVQLSALHDAGLAHLDVHGSNVLLFEAEDGPVCAELDGAPLRVHAVLADCSFVSKDCEFEELYGKITVRPPEAAAKESPYKGSCASDVFMLGCVLHALCRPYPSAMEMLTDKNTSAEHLRALDVVCSDRQARAVWREDAPVELVSFGRAAMSWDAAARPGARELVAALE